VHSDKAVQGSSDWLTIFAHDRAAPVRCVRIDVAHMIEAIDFDTLAIENGRLRLTNGDPQFATIRASLPTSFLVEN